MGGLDFRLLCGRCQLYRCSQIGRLLTEEGEVRIRAFSGLVALPAAGYNYNSDWTPLLAGLSPARMAASFAARSIATGWNPAAGPAMSAVRRSLPKW